MLVTVPINKQLLSRRFFVFGIGALCLVLFFAAGLSDGASASFNHTWAAEFGATLTLSSPYPKHLPGLWSSLGGHDFFFYGPLPFWTAGGLIAPLCPGCATSTELLLTAAFFWFFSGATFFLFARRYFGPKMSLLGSLVYLVLPYHLWLDWFMRQAIGEFAAFAFLPLIALGVDSVRSDGRHGWIVAIGVAGLALCHLPTTLLAAHVFLAVALVSAVRKWRINESIRPFLLSLSLWGLLGMLMSSFYWVPALSLLDTVSPHILFSGFFEANTWLWGSTSGPQHSETSWIMLCAFLATVPVVGISLIYARGALLVWIVVPVALTVLMNSAVSAPIWDAWIIQKVQFPWRFLVFNDFAASIAVMTVLARTPVHTRSRLVIILTFMALAPCYKILQPSAEAIMTGYDEATMPNAAMEYLSPETSKAIEQRFHITLSHKKYVLVVPEILDLMAKDVSKQLPDGVVIESASRSYIIKNVPDQQKLVLPIQYWQFWTGQLDDGTPLHLSANPDFGVIEVLAPEGGFNGQSIHLTLPYHISEKISLVLSFLSVAAFAYLIGTARRRRKPDQQDALQHVQ